ncbi:MAG: GAP family protein [Candidatus Nanopelagicales bacterium]
MNDLLTQVLPFAIAAAISPTVLTVVVLILAGGQKPLARAWAFALGGVLFTVVFVFLSVTVLGNLNDADSGHQSTMSRVVKLTAAAVLLLLAARQLLRARKAGPPSGSSKWQKRLATARTIDFVGVGALVMLGNASTLVMILAGAHVVTVSQAPDSAKVAAAVMLGVFASLPLLVPVVGVTAFGSHATGALDRLNTFTTVHKAAINAGILVFFAVLLVWSGVKA